MKSITGFSLGILALFASLQTMRADSYTFTSLPLIPNGINDAGQIVGFQAFGEGTAASCTIRAR